MASSTIKRIDARVRFSLLSECTTLVEALNSVPLGFTITTGWGTGTITDFPSGLSPQKALVFLKGSAENIYNSVLLS